MWVFTLPNMSGSYAQAAFARLAAEQGYWQMPGSTTALRPAPCLPAHTPHAKLA